MRERAPLTAPASVIQAGLVQTAAIVPQRTTGRHARRVVATVHCQMAQLWHVLGTAVVMVAAHMKEQVNARVITTGTVVWCVPIARTSLLARTATCVTPASGECGRKW